MKAFAGGVRALLGSAARAEAEAEGAAEALRRANERADAAERRASQLEAELLSAEARAKEAHVEAARMAAERDEAAAATRKLRHALHEARGTVRVLCRVRPSLPTEGGCSVGGAGAAVRCLGEVDDVDGGEAVMFVAPAGAPRGPLRSYDDVLGGMRCAAASADRGVVETAEGDQGRVVRFDRVLGPASEQQDVFAELAPLVEGVMRGRSACLVAFGPSGSGKTHTLYGPPAPAAGCGRRGGRGDETAAAQAAAGGGVGAAGGLWSAAGVVPRAAAVLAAAAAGTDAGGRSRQRLTVAALSISAVEVYNEEVRDLIHEHDPSSMEPDGPRPIRGGIDGAVWLRVGSAADASAAIETALRRRSSRGTEINETSSRSHMIVRLRASLEAPWRRKAAGAGGQRGKAPAAASSGGGAGGGSASSGRAEATLAIADLAGSERARASGTVRAGKAAALAETGAVNKSLSALSNVMMALAAQDKFVPFRDSALTRCLQPYLSGRSRTVLLVAVSPGAKHAGLTLRALEFGARVSMVRG
ncbi:hypothetical protein FNF31_00042 [Cafeteria roenbergensis]|nr:hypothetical protein FNF31_00042 [Cafeteria roenbergensis]